MHRRNFRTCVALAAALLLAAPTIPAAASSHGCQEGMEAWEGYWLYFGRNRDGKEVISEYDWEDFLATTVSTVLPDGFTLFDARGQWKTDSGVIERERTKVINVVIPKGADGWNRVKQIGRAYRERFGQEFVLKVSEEVCVAF